MRSLGAGRRIAFRAGPIDWACSFTPSRSLEKDFEGTLAKVAEAGYKEVELFGSLGDRNPKEVRAMLDRAGLSAVSTHIGLAPGPDLEKQLEGYQIIGHRFTAVRAGGGGRGAPPESNPVERWKREAAALNQVGQAGKKFGIRALFHNHVAEYIPIGGAGTPEEILLAETDPALVVMELDVGWANIAGQDVLGMFKKNPGRYALWHVKDSTGLAAAKARPIEERQKAAQFVPVGPATSTTGWCLPPRQPPACSIISSNRTTRSTPTRSPPFAPARRT